MRTTPKTFPESIDLAKDFLFRPSHSLRKVFLAVRARTKGQEYVFGCQFRPIVYAWPERHTKDFGFLTLSLVYGRIFYALPPIRERVETKGFGLRKEHRLLAHISIIRAS